MRSIRKIAVCLALAAVAGLATAQPLPSTGPTQGPGRPGLERAQADFWKSTGLSDALVTQVKDLTAKFRSNAKTKRAEIGVVEAQIKLAMTAATPDLNAVNGLVDKKTQLRADLEKQTLALAARIHQLVGDEAFAKIEAAYLQRHHARMGGHQGPGMGPAGMPGSRF